MSNQPIVKALQRIHANLLAAHIFNDDQVWQQIGKNRNNELANLAATMGITVQQLLEAVTPAVLDQADHHRLNWLKRHALDIVLAITALLFGGLVASTLYRLPTAGTQQVVAKRDLAPFEEIRKEDIELRQAVRKASAFERMETVVGRYALQPVPKGTVFTSAILSSGKLQGPMAKRTVLLVPLKIGKTSLPWKLPATVTLLVSPKKLSSPKSLVLDNTYLLSLQTSGDSTMAYVAVAAARLRDLAAILADSDVFLAQPAQP